MTISINPCRPGFGASCSFCCGSHNFTVSPAEIEDIFINRGYNQDDSTGLHPEQSMEEKLVSEGMQCPNIGISGSDPSIVCCLVYTSPSKGPGLESFFKGTCRHFQCAAFSSLADREVLFAAELMKDWYYYSLLINSIETVKELYAEYGNSENVPAHVLDDIKEELVQSLLEDDMI